MSRFGDSDSEGYALWKGRLSSHINGKNGQAMLREMRDALLALPTKRLIEGALIDEQGECCAVGALVKKRQSEGRNIEAPIGDCDSYDTATAGEACGMHYVLAWSIGWLNDEMFDTTPEARYSLMLGWIERHIKEADQRIQVDW